MYQNHKDMESVVEALVQEHFELDDSLEKVVWFKYGKRSEICLLHVTADTLPTDDVLSFHFSTSDDVPFPLQIAQITPDEWKKVLSKNIPLPDDWSLKNYKVYSRNMVLV